MANGQLLALGGKSNKIDWRQILMVVSPHQSLCAKHLPIAAPIHSITNLCRAN